MLRRRDPKPNQIRHHMLPEDAPMRLLQFHHMRYRALYLYRYEEYEFRLFPHKGVGMRFCNRDYRPHAYGKNVSMYVKLARLHDRQRTFRLGGLVISKTYWRFWKQRNRIASFKRTL